MSWKARVKHPVVIVAAREFPGEHAWRRRCYMRARDMFELHDCGGELAHLPE